MKLTLKQLKNVISEEINRARSLNENPTASRHLPTLVMSKCEEDIMGLAQSLAIELESVSPDGDSVDAYLPEVHARLVRCIENMLEEFV